MRSKPKIHHVEDMYREYALSLLAANLDWKGTLCSNCKIKNGTITRPYDAFDNKLKNKRMVVMTYQMFSKIVQTYFTYAKEAIIQGEVLSLGNRLGKITAVRIQRNFKNKTIDYPETAKQPKVWSEEKQKMVASKVIYYITEDYCRIKWFKTRSVKNDYLYEFEPAKQGSGNRISLTTMLCTALTETPLLRFKYVYYPFVKLTHNAV